MVLFFLFISLLVTPDSISVEPTEETKEYMLRSVNRLRAKGCKCGRKKMPPVGPVKWDDLLYDSAESHAYYLTRRKELSHFGRRGEDISERIADTGYPWAVVGENLGMGQKTFPEVMKDWIKSKAHCRMLMNPKVEDMAVAKINNVWVQHFGKKKEN